MEELAHREQYELAFHLLPSFEGGLLEEKRGGIEEIISKNGGIISRVGEIRKIRLAYPIRGEKFSNFGYIEFSIPKSGIEEINKNLQLNENFLRYLIIKKEMMPVKIAKPAMPKTEKPKETAVDLEKQKLEEEEIDKKIEELLEKL